jgi:tungstate transport system ATP-binding protein
MLDTALMLDWPVGLEASAGLLPLAVRGLAFEAGGKRLVDDIDLDIVGGGITVVMGPNGAGKTLLLRLLHGLIDPTAGEVRWGGRRLDEALRKRQAMVFQRPVLLRRSVAANVAFALRLRGSATAARCEALLRHVGLGELARRPARLLSVGEQQRLALARALAVEPEVLLLDEPTASLDPASTAAIEGIIRAAHLRGVKIILVTHDLGQAQRLADEVVFLHRGRLVEQSAAASFFDAPRSPEARDYRAGRLVI